LSMCSQRPVLAKGVGRLVLRLCRPNGSSLLGVTNESIGPL
jgi:hypothetical protein